MKLIILGPTFQVHSWSIMLWTPTLSKAFEKSRAMMEMCFLHLSDLVIRWSASSRLSETDLPCLKPDWLGLIRLFLVTNHQSRLAIIFSKVLARQQLREIGL